MSASFLSRLLRRTLIGLTVAALLGLHAWLALSASRQKSPTSDEAAHLTAGLAYWEFNDYRLQPENGNLPQRWEALPAWWSGQQLPAQHPDWAVSNVWGIGRAYFRAQGEGLEQTIFAARAMNMVWSVATGLLIWWWARRLFGMAGAFVALGFFTFCPTFLAHGALATSDMCMTFFMLASVGAYWRHLRDFRFSTGLLSAAIIGLACVAKFSFVLLPFMFAPLLLWRIFSSAPFTWRGKNLAGRFARLWLLLISTTAHVLVAWCVIWLCFGFRHDSTNSCLPGLTIYHRPWDIVIASLGTKSTGFELLRQARLLPDAFLYGFAFVVDMSQMRGAFLNGQYSVSGWPEFFPYAFLVKTPLPLLAGILASVGLAGWRWRRTPRTFVPDLIRTLPLISLFAVYWIFSVTSHLNIGHRHILPTYPVLFIATGALGWWMMRVRLHLTAGLVVAALLLTQAVVSFQIRPHYLAFFNPLAGGPQHGYRHLVDSSLDWGQDLPGLAAWLKINGTPSTADERVYFSYFGTADPAHYGIKALPLPTLPSSGVSAPWYTLRPGIYAISATMLSHVYSPYGGKWTLALEHDYELLRHLEPRFLEYARSTGDARTQLEASMPAMKWRDLWDQYELLRFARLCYYLRVRTPDANIGYSILIYRLSPAEIEAALGGSIEDWTALIEKTITAGPDR
ncbi:MAG: glycosyltransferase family 39 protein [Opitutaceae bacterium]|nr:glycosyltransferase family 39 protein [Opitutaceae bacterium]